MWRTERRVFGYDPIYIAGIALGGIVGIYLFSILFRYALLGRSGTKLQQTWVVLLTGIVAIGFSAFGDGTNGFVNRITNTPDIPMVIGYSVSALIVGFFIYLRVDERAPPPEKKTTGSIVGRAVALVFVIPMILIGLGNIGGSVYGLAVHGLPPGPGWGTTRAEFRDIMLNGDLAPFWRVVDERAPADLDHIIERLFAQEDDIRSEEQARQMLAREVVTFRVSLATYAAALTDMQRKEILQSSLDLLRAFEDQPALCVDIAMTGGQKMTQEQLRMGGDLLNRNMIVTTENLLDARQAATGGASLPKPPTEQDYGMLVQLLYERGVPEDQLQALFNEDMTHPQFCQAQIAFLGALIDLEGASGDAVRFEVSQAMLVATPQD